ncbi:Pentatricopeptide repeat-containing protein [Carex littledalei]|uniref:Pentatricopeptide repeat-containing protein n=1 Tax=Carex littledalei TaxID=544730 RepID=A0A833QW80_9POAL|nr:Pentatricopeptide repeat-containing protein [Carex littledalei]
MADKLSTTFIPHSAAFPLRTPSPYSYNIPFQNLNQNLTPSTPLSSSPLPAILQRTPISLPSAPPSKSNYETPDPAQKPWIEHLSLRAQYALRSLLTTSTDPDPDPSSLNETLSFLSLYSNQSSSDALISDLLGLILALDHHNKPLTALSVFNWACNNTPGDALFSNGGQPLVPFIIRILGRLGRLSDASSLLSLVLEHTDDADADADAYTYTSIITTYFLKL